MKIKVTIEGNIEYNSYSTLWVQPIPVLEPHSNSYKLPLLEPTGQKSTNLGKNKSMIWMEHRKSTLFTFMSTNKTVFQTSPQLIKIPSFGS